MEAILAEAMVAPKSVTQSVRDTAPLTSGYTATPCASLQPDSSRRLSVFADDSILSDHSAGSERTVVADQPVFSDHRSGAAQQ